jgi:hypothetical protein
MRAAQGARERGFGPARREMRAYYLSFFKKSFQKVLFKILLSFFNKTLDLFKNLFTLYIDPNQFATNPNLINSFPLNKINASGMNAT